MCCPAVSPAAAWARHGSARLGWARGAAEPPGQTEPHSGKLRLRPRPRRPTPPAPPGSAVPQRERIAEQPVLGREEPSSEQLPPGRVLPVPPQKRLMALHCQVWFVGSVLSSSLDQVHQYFTFSCFAKWCL